MCRSCQSCFETFYWHCFEKHCCYDESIALYQEGDDEKLPNGTTNGGSAPADKQPEKNNNHAKLMFDNMSFYDSVAIIANRAIFTIEPLKSSISNNLLTPVALEDTAKDTRSFAPSSVPIIEQPRSRVVKRCSIENELATTIEEKADELSIVSTSDSRKPSCDFTIPTITEDLIPNSPEKSLDNSTDSIDSGGLYFNVKSLANHSIEFARSDPCNLNQNALSVARQEPIRLRKKSLHERRAIPNLRLQLIRDHRSDVPVIRQNSMPKFYLETPTDNQLDSALVRSPSMALSSPVAPNNEFTFDLKSIVQIEKDRSNVSINKYDRNSKDIHALAHLSHKFRSIKRHASAANLQNRAN